MFEFRVIEDIFKTGYFKISNFLGFALFISVKFLFKYQNFMIVSPDWGKVPQMLKNTKCLESRRNVFLCIFMKFGEIITN